MIVLSVQECEVCRQVVMITHDEGREVAVDLHSKDPHECFDVPEGAELLVMEDEIPHKSRAYSARVRQPCKPCNQK